MGLESRPFIHPLVLVSEIFISGPAVRVLMSIIGTLLQTGGIPTRLGPPVEGSKENTVLEKGQVRETREFDGKTYSMEKAIKGDVAILRAWKVDEAGNCQFR